MIIFIQVIKSNKIYLNQLYTSKSGTYPASPGFFEKLYQPNKKDEKLFSISRKTTLGYSIQVFEI